MSSQTSDPARPSPVHVPLRTCVGCREKSAKTELLRVVAVEGAIVPDQRGRAPGRGAYLHPAGECLARAEKRRAFPRALRADGPLETTAVRELLEGGEQAQEH